MSINRQQRRQAQRQAAGDGPGDGARLGTVSDVDLDVDSLGAPERRPGRVARPIPAAAPVRHRLAPRQFLHEVNVEMRKVAWPSRAETFNYSTVVFVTLAVLMGLIFLLDLAFSHLAAFLFNP